ncbi:MAG: hypothetical protein QM537_07370 [Candidatus Symbiobacter sp.]|nr:hypothetical protein [Candidatus Symbiobacter sp.]
MFRSQPNVSNPKPSWSQESGGMAFVLQTNPKANEASAKPHHSESHLSNPVSAIEREIIECNQILQNWLSGSCPQTEEVFARLSDQLASGFNCITCDGRMMKREALLMRLRDHYGVKGRDYRLTIDNLRVIVQTAVLVVVSYDEHEYFTVTNPDLAGQKQLDLPPNQAHSSHSPQSPQSPQSDIPARSHYVTSVLALNNGKRNLIEWLHRHETGHP